MPKRLRKKANHSDEIVKRAKAFAASSDGLVAELYLIHAGICEANQKARRIGKRRKK